MSRLLDFYRGTATDDAGRTLSDVWGFSDDEMEEHHDFIQWLFPLCEPSRFNPHAPLLSEADIAAFRAEASLRDHVLRSFDRFLGFLGLEAKEGAVRPGPRFARKRDLWLYPNHNWLRITRVLHSLRLLGLEAECTAFFCGLNELRERGQARISDDTWSYWQDAAS
ncbi:MAG: opioid growth factor receptor-related protein [Isosphaeraceae bacterium]|nr:opioid growth factor receptor-related protein [Isosphaeraceae bacterium]